VAAELGLPSGDLETIDSDAERPSG